MNARRRRRRARPAPLALVLVALALPAVGLAVVWRVAEARNIPPTPIVTPTDLPEPAPKLATQLASMRRVPTLIADEVDAQQTTAATKAMLASVTNAVGDGSCLLMYGGFGDDSEPIVAKASSEPVIPASNQKLLVAYTALVVLGPDYTYSTQVWGRPPIDGTIVGDLFLVGGGDPLLSTNDFIDPQRYDSFNRTSLDDLADLVALIGVRKVEGSIVGDGGRYDDEFRVESWGPGIGPSEGGPYDALLVNDSAVAPGEYALEPNRAGAVQFNRLLRERGIATSASGNYPRPDDPELVELASVTSLPMSEILTEMLQASDNNTAEMVLKEIGFVAKGEGTRQAGLDTVWATLSEQGIPLDGVQLADGSGLSRDNRVTCATLNALLRSDIGEQLVDLLPVAGRTGTLQPQLVNTPAEGTLHAKTGTLTGVKALSGEMPDDEGNPVVFSLVLNGPAANDPGVYGPVWNVLVQTVSDYPPQITIDPTQFEPLTSN